MTIEKLICKLDTASDHEAAAVIKQLLKKPGALAALLESAEFSPQPRVRKWSVLALGYFKDSRSLRVLRKSLQDKRMTIRQQAVRALGQRKNPAVKKDLLRMLGDESGGIRLNALEALRPHLTKKNLDQISALLRDEKNYIRRKAQGICADLEKKV